MRRVPAFEAEFLSVTWTTFQSLAISLLGFLYLLRRQVKALHICNLHACSSMSSSDFLEPKRLAGEAT